MATGATFTWKVTPEEAFSRGVKAYTAKQRQAVFLLLQHFAPQIENDMKAAAPWIDRTGNLRQSLWAEARQLVTSAVLVFDYGLDYGEYLEFSHAGHYAIIAPTVDKWAPIVFEAVKALLGGAPSFGSVSPTKE